MERKGLTAGSGRKGYYNVIGKDPQVHRQSAMGIKQPQRVQELKLGQNVNSVFTQAKGRVISKKPFAVEYTFEGKRYARIDNPKHWKVHKGGKNSPEQNREVATTILQQLGGNRFIAMTGAKNFLIYENALGFKIPKAKDGINRVKITLKENDLYDVEYLMIKDLKVYPKKKDKDIYNDQLQTLFTARTGLYTKI